MAVCFPSSVIVHVCVSIVGYIHHVPVCLILPIYECVVLDVFLVHMYVCKRVWPGALCSSVFLLSVCVERCGTAPGVA